MTVQELINKLKKIQDSGLLSENNTIQYKTKEWSDTLILCVNTYKLNNTIKKSWEIEI